jgi:hypothetical protein
MREDLAIKEVYRHLRRPLVEGFSRPKGMPGAGQAAAIPVIFWASRVEVTT